MSDKEQAELQAVRELSVLVHHLTEELATFRRRAIQAEARLRAFETEQGQSNGVSAARLKDLEDENAILKQRLERAAGLAQHGLRRLRFLRQQAETTATLSDVATLVGPEDR